MGVGASKASCGGGAGELPGWGSVTPALLRWLVVLMVALVGIVLLVEGWAALFGARVAREHEVALNAATLLERTGDLPPSLPESSGLAVSRAHPGVLWTHNDAGDPPMLYAVDLAGRELARVRVRGAGARDWEALALGPCLAGMDGQHCLYVGDIGDNERQREHYTVYVVPEPEVWVADSGRVGTVLAAAHLTFRYPDGRHDAEALAVTPAGDVIIVTKGRNRRIQVFGLGRAGMERARLSPDTVTAEYLGDLPIRADRRIGRLATGTAISPAGTTLAVRTYTELFFFTLSADGGLTPAGSPCFLGTAAGVAEPQGEAVDYLDEETLVLTSEAWRGVGPIHRVRCG